MIVKNLLLGQENKIFSFSGFSSQEMMRAGGFLFYFLFFGAWFITNHAHLRPTSCKKSLKSDWS